MESTKTQRTTQPENTHASQMNMLNCLTMKAHPEPSKAAICRETAYY